MAVFCMAMTQDYMDEQIFVIPENFVEISLLLTRDAIIIKQWVVVMNLRSFRIVGLVKL